MPPFLAIAASAAAETAIDTAAAAALETAATTAGAAAEAAGSAAVAESAALPAFTQTLISFAAATALSYGISALTAKKLDDQPGQQTVRQGLPARFVILGRQKSAGVLFFYDTTADGRLCVGKVLACHQIDGFEEHFLFDYPATIVNPGPDSGQPVVSGRLGWGTHIVISTGKGPPNQLADAALAIAWASLGIWGASFRLRGLAYGVLFYQDDNVKDGTFGTIYPNGAPEYKPVIRGRLVFDPRDPTQDINTEATWKYSDNWALIVAFYLMHADGWGLGAGVIDTDNLADQASVCEQPMATPAGGTEPRWRVWGRYTLDEPRKSVLNDLLLAGAGRIALQGDGRVRITAGRFIAPSVTLDDTMIRALEDFIDGPEAVERVDQVAPRIIYDVQNWQDFEVPPWIPAPPAGSVTGSTTNVLDLPLRFCPSPYQAQRIAKKIADEKNAGWRGNVRCNLAGLAAYGQTTIKLSIAELPNLNGLIFEVLNVALDIVSMTVVISVRQMSADVWDWTAASGTVVSDPASPAASAFPAPPPTNVQTAANADHTITISWDNPIIGVGGAPLVVSNQVQYRPHAAPGPDGWIEIDPPTGTTSMSTPPLTVNNFYDIQVRSVGQGGNHSDWVTVFNIKAI